MSKSNPTWLSLGSLERESSFVSNSIAMNLFSVNCDEFTSPKYSPELPNVKGNPSPHGGGDISLPAVKVIVVKKDAVVLERGSKKAIGCL